MEEIAQKLEYEIKKGYVFKVRIQDKQKYRDVFLKICNRVRKDNAFIRVDNNDRNDVIIVVCAFSAFEICKKWLSGFGNVVACEMIFYLNCNMDAFYYSGSEKYALTINPY